jgi:hypothetical protein
MTAANQNQSPAPASTAAAGKGPTAAGKPTSLPVPPVPAARRFFMPPAPRSLPAADAVEPPSQFSLQLEQPEVSSPAAASGLVINPVEPQRRRRSDTTLLIAILVALAVIVVGLGLAVLFSPGVQ